MGNYAPFISDHCPIFYNIITNNLGRVTPEPSLEEVPKSFRLSQDDQTKLKEILGSAAMEERINGLSHETDPHTLASGISNTLFDAWESADIQPIKTKTYSVIVHLINPERIMK